MEYWPTSNIKRGDLVLMEVHVVRFQTDSGGNIVHDGSWDCSTVELELRAVCMLSKGDNEFQEFTTLSS